MEHVLYETKDADKPRDICDRNGEVVLSLCRVCRQAEADLEPKCPGQKVGTRQCTCCDGRGWGYSIDDCDPRQHTCPQCKGTKVEPVFIPGPTKTQDTEKNFYKVHD